MRDLNIRVLTINTHKGFSIFKQRFMLHELRESIRLISADLVFLQEVLGEHQAWSTRYKDVWPEAAQYEFLADSIWQDFAYGRNAVYTGGHHGNALLSKYPITHWENHDLSIKGTEKRGILHCQIAIPGSDVPLHAMCVHLSLRERHRQIELQKLCEFVNDIPSNEPVVVAGDFNDWRQKSQNLLHSKANLVEVFNHTYGEPAKTFPAFFPLLRLDRIYVRSTKTNTPFVLPHKPWSKLSDHAPLLAEIELTRSN